MAALRSIRRSIARFRADETGTALVETAVALPLMLFLFAFAIEAGRMLWTHQVIVGGVRDAARYVARTAPSTVCLPGGAGNIAAQTGTLANIVTQSSASANLLLGSVSVGSVTGTLGCQTGTYRINPVGVATVTANVSITYPFAGMFALVGAATPGVLTYQVSDMARIHGE